MPFFAKRCYNSLYFLAPLCLFIAMSFASISAGMTRLASPKLSLGSNMTDNSDADVSSNIDALSWTPEATAESKSQRHHAGEIKSKHNNSRLQPTRSRKWQHGKPLMNLMYFLCMYYTIMCTLHTRTCQSFNSA